MDDAQELTLLCWEEGREPEGGWVGALGMLEGRLLRELQRLVEPHLEESRSTCGGQGSQEALLPPDLLPSAPFPLVTAGCLVTILAALKESLFSELIPELPPCTLIFHMRERTMSRVELESQTDLGLNLASNFEQGSVKTSISSYIE